MANDAAIEDFGKTVGLHLAEAKDILDGLGLKVPA